MYILPVTVMDLMKTRLERTWGSMVGLCSERAAVPGINVRKTGFLDRMFLQSFRRWTLVVEREIGRCLRTSLYVRPGQVEKYPASITFVNVLTTGIKYARCIYWTKSRLVVIEYDICRRGDGTGPRVRG